MVKKLGIENACQVVQILFDNFPVSFRFLILFEQLNSHIHQCVILVLRKH